MKDVVKKEVFEENVLTQSLKAKKKIKLDVEVNEKYNFLTLILLFFCFAIIGWIVECIWMFLKQGIIVNRGTLIGPWLPIYGYSCIFILILFSSDKCEKITKKPVITFLAIMALCAIGEYVTSAVLEAIYGMRWWDYSNELFNINGRICLETTLLFGIGGCLCLYNVAPALNKKIKEIPRNIKIVIAVILVILYMIDKIYCLGHPHIGMGIAFKVSL